MNEIRYYLEVTDAAGNTFGDGYITSCIQWSSTFSMDRAGEFVCIVPAADPQAQHLQNNRFVTCTAIIPGQGPREIGSGRIGNIQYVLAPTGTLLKISGIDRMVELADKSVQFLALGNSGLISFTTSLNAIMSYAPSGWSYVTDPAPPYNALMYRFAGESVLAALRILSSYSRSHFFLSGPKQIAWRSSFLNSGMTAIDQPVVGVGSDPSICFIQNYVYERDSQDIFTRIYPFGGWYESDLYSWFITIQDSYDGPYPGYTHNRNQNWIQNTAGFNTYGLRERVIQYPEIKVTFFTGGYSLFIWYDLSNLIYNRAMADLEQYSVLGEFFVLHLQNCQRVLKPLEYIRVIINRVENGKPVLRVDQLLLILQSTIIVDRNGIRTTKLEVSNVNRYRRTDPFTTIDFRNRIFNDFFG